MPRAKKLKTIHGQTKLSFGAPAQPVSPQQSPMDVEEILVADDKNETETSETAETSNLTTESPAPNTSTLVENTAGSKEKTKKRHFNSHWKLTRSWLSFDGKAMYCSVCKNAGCRNIFTEEGSTNFKTSTLDDHAKSKEHQQALIVPSEQDNAKKLEEKVLSSEKKNVVTFLKATHWLIKEEIPLSKLESLVQLLNDLDTPDVGTVGDHTSRYSANEFLKALPDEEAAGGD